MKMEKIAVIGRFEPFHKGHAPLLDQAFDSGEHVLIVLGSSFKARNAKNPFIWEERAAMISSTLNEDQKSRVSFIPVRDYYDDTLWSNEIIRAVQDTGNKDAREIGLIGLKKDASSYYLDLFPGWNSINSQQHGKIDATSIRQIYFETENQPAARALLSGLLPESVAAYMDGWKHLPQYQQMQEEHFAIEAYKKRWGEGPFTTVDAIVTVSEHVLLVRRNHHPGKGLWAIPGGYLEQRERLIQAAIRELKEETNLALIDSTIAEKFKKALVFDRADRSLRGRVITHVHHFDFGDSRLFEVKADGIETLEAKWFPIADLDKMESQLFEDHFSILTHFLKI